MWNVGHAVAEVWSNEYRKWVMMDPDINVHYERDGTPLNALEIREAWLDGVADEVEMVQDQPKFVIPDARHVRLALRDPTCRKDYDEEVNRHLFARFLRNRVMDYYARVRVLTDRRTLEWVDRRCLPTFVSNFKPLGPVRLTSSLPDVYWTVNLVRISTHPSWDEDGDKAGRNAFALYAVLRPLRDPLRRRGLAAVRRAFRLADAGRGAVAVMQGREFDETNWSSQPDRGGVRPAARGNRLPLIPSITRARVVHLPTGESWDDFNRG